MHGFDTVGMALVSKAFFLARACIMLLEADFEDEALGLCRSIVECGWTLRFLTLQGSDGYHCPVNLLAQNDGVSFPKAAAESFLCHALLPCRGAASPLIPPVLLRDLEMYQTGC